MKAKDLKDEFIRKVKIYCEVLKIDYEEFSGLSLEEQINFIKSLEISNISLGTEAKAKLIRILEEEENIRFDKDIERVLRMANREDDDGSR